jgi:sirohydrochlorin ferrochelatase
VNPLILVAHGSSDRRAARSTRALVRAVAAARPGLDVRAAFLDHTAPSLGAVLGTLARGGYPAAVVVPLLLTEAYHGRVDIPAVLAEARAAGLPLSVRQAPVLGPAVTGSHQPATAGGSGSTGAGPRATRVDDELIDAVRRRLGEIRVRYDGVVLAAAGTRDAAARSTVDDVAAALGASLGVPCVAGYASATGPARPGAARPPTASFAGGEAVARSGGGAVARSGGGAVARSGGGAVARSVGDAVAALRAQGSARVAVASYFLAPGLLHDRALSMAFSAGAVDASAPLGAAPELARLVLRRAAVDLPAEPATLPPRAASTLATTG